MEIKEFIEKIAEALEIDNPENINQDTYFRELDEWNSLGGLSIIAMFDEEFDKELGISEFKEAETIGDLYELSK